jgi:hypothetical protein
MIKRFVSLYALDIYDFVACLQETQMFSLFFVMAIFFFTEYVIGSTLFAALLDFFQSFLLAKLNCSFYPSYD